MFIIYDFRQWETLMASNWVYVGGSLGTSMGNFAKQEGRYLKSGAVLCWVEEQLQMGFQQSGGKGPYLFSTVKSRGKLEGVADAQMLSSESFIKPFPRVASPPEGCLRITVSLLNGGTPVFKPLNDLWWGEPWQVYFSSTPRILMSPCSYLLTP